MSIISETEAAERLGREFFVTVSEEYGFRYWIWFPGMTAAELELWWSSLEDVMSFYMNPGLTLPGDLCQYHDEGYVWRESFNSDAFYYAHIHNNSDSFLLRPKREKILHKGFKDMDM